MKGEGERGGVAPRQPESVKQLGRCHTQHAAQQDNMPRRRVNKHVYVCVCKPSPRCLSSAWLRAVLLEEDVCRLCDGS